MATKKDDKKVAHPALAQKQGVDAPAFPIVGVGASAGGLEAFEQFFRNAPPDCGAGFVLVSHLDPDHISILTEILLSVTASCG